MNKLLNLIFICFIFGCSPSTQNKTIIVANEIHDIALEENKIITDYCVPKYQKALTKEDVENADKICLPAENSYYMVKATWTSLVILLESAKYNEIKDSDIQQEAQKLAIQLKELYQLTKAMK